jgi:hypothetical protein
MRRETKTAECVMLEAFGERFITIEEHYRSCGLGEALSHRLLTSGVIPESLTCLHAAGYPSGRYGSQRDEPALQRTDTPALAPGGERTQGAFVGLALGEAPP